MRRKQGVLLPIEESILSAAAQLRQQGIGEFYGFQIAKAVADHTRSRLLTGYGTLYRALFRLVRMGMLHSRWEDPTIGAEQDRPRRRYYHLANKATDGA